MVEIEVELHKGIQMNEFPDEKSEEGKFDEPYEDYSWEMEVKKVELPAPMTGEEGGFQQMIGQQLTKEISKTVRELKLKIKWLELGEEQSVDVVTHIVKL